MRVLFINQYYLPDFAATAQILGDIAEELARQGHEVHVLSGSAIYDGRDLQLPARETINGVRVHRVRQRFAGRSRLYQRALGYLFFHIGAHLRALILPKPDVVVTLTTPPLICLAGWWMGALRGVRHVSWVMDIYPDIAIRSGVLPSRGVVATLWAFLGTMVLRRADRVVTLSKGMKEVIEGKGVESARITLVAPWADAGALEPPEEPNPFRQEHAAGAQTVVMYSGNMGTCHPWKEIAEAVIRLEDREGIQFLFVGGGKAMDLLHNAVKDRPNARFLPYQDREVLGQSLSAADIHLTSLDDRMDGLLLPSKLFGIMGVGRPILHVGSPTSDVADLLRENHCGLIIPPGGGSRLAGLIATLADDPGQRRRMGEAGRSASVWKYDRTILVPRLAELLEEEADGRGLPARRTVLWASPLLRVAVMTLLLAWGAAGWLGSQEFFRWSGQLEGHVGAATLADAAATAPARSSAMRRLARAATDRVFPRRWDVAEEAAEQWLALRPFAQEPWVLLARARAMRGNRAEAMAALEQAGWLAPSFPAGLLEGLPVWVLLGERDRAVQLAREVVSLDRDAPLEVAPPLQAAGFSPAETAALTFREDLDAATALRLLNLIARPTTQAQEQVYPSIPPRLLDDPEFRSRAAQIFTAPLAPAALEDLCRRHSPEDLAILALPDGGRLLTMSPLHPGRPEGSFPLGWRNPPERSARSLLASTRGNPSLQWRIEFRPGEPARASLLHRFLLDGPAPAFPVVLHLEVFPTHHLFRLVVEGPGGRSAGEWVSAVAGDRLALMAEVRPSGEAAIIDLLLECRPTSGDRSGPRIEIVGLEFPGADGGEGLHAAY